jgi:hypothetical protein
MSSNCVCFSSGSLTAPFIFACLSLFFFLRPQHLRAELARKAKAGPPAVRVAAAQARVAGAKVTAIKLGESIVAMKKRLAAADSVAAAEEASLAGLRAQARALIAENAKLLTGNAHKGGAKAAHKALLAARAKVASLKSRIAEFERKREIQVGSLADHLALVSQRALALAKADASLKSTAAAESAQAKLVIGKVKSAKEAMHARLDSLMRRQKQERADHHQEYTRELQRLKYGWK